MATIPIGLLTINLVHVVNCQLFFHIWQIKQELNQERFKQDFIINGLK